MRPRARAGGRAGAVHPTRALSMTTRSRKQAGLNAPATTPTPGPSTLARNAATTDDEPLPVYGWVLHNRTLGAIPRLQMRRVTRIRLGQYRSHQPHQFLPNHGSHQ